MAPASSAYTEANIRVLEGIEAIRLRPGMYIGDTTPRGLHHLVYEVVDNSIDEAMAGHCRHIHVTIHADGSASIVDDGRGIPVGPHHQFADKSTLEVVLTKPHAGGKFDHDTYKVSGGPARRRRDGRQRAVGVAGGRGPSRGPGLAPGLRAGRAARARSASSGRPRRPAPRSASCPTPTIFDKIDFDYDVLEKRLRELAYLNRGVAIRLTDERGDEPRQEEFYSSGGLSEFVAYLNRAQNRPAPAGGALGQRRGARR